MDTNSFLDVFNNIITLKNKAGNLLDKGNKPAAIEFYNKAIIESNKILSKAQTTEDFFDLHYLLGAFYLRVGSLDNAIIHAKKAVELNKKSETASLSLYLCFVETNDAKNAIGEILRYSNTYKINIYKDTVYELMSDESDGLLPSFKNELEQLYHNFAKQQEK